MRAEDDTIWTVPLAVLAAVALLILAALALRGFYLWYRRQTLSAIFHERLSPGSIAIITREPRTLDRSGKTRTITAISCAVRNYAALCERFTHEPAAFAALIGTVMTPLSSLAKDAGGLVSPFDGESIGAVWNAPLNDEEHALHACQAADRMAASLAAANASLRAMQPSDGKPFEEIELEIGIATGQAIAGAFDDARYAYGVTGEPLLLARHLRKLCAQYGFPVVSNEQTKNAAGQGVAFLELDNIAGLQGEPMRLYAMFGNPMMRASPKFRALSTFHDHIFEAIRRQHWSRARLLIEQCRKLSGASQKLYDLHEARIAWYEKSAPPKDWDGAFRAILN